jgi:hypothetical protein
MFLRSDAPSYRETLGFSWSDRAGLQRRLVNSTGARPRAAPRISHPDHSHTTRAHPCSSDTSGRARWWTRPRRRASSCRRRLSTGPRSTASQTRGRSAYSYGRLWTVQRGVTPRVVTCAVIGWMCYRGWHPQLSPPERLFVVLRSDARLARGRSRLTSLQRPVLSHRLLLRAGPDGPFAL